MAYNGFRYGVGFLRILKTKLNTMIKEETKDLTYWKANAEQDYTQVPISVLRYITELETVVKNCSIPDVVKSFCECEEPSCRIQDNTYYCNSCDKKLK